jgi:hypothetical protein
MRSLRPCSADIQFKNRKTPLVHSDEYYRREAPRLRESDDDDQWLSTVTERWEEWIERGDEWKIQYTRAPACSSYDLLQTTTIHHDYFIGEIVVYVRQLLIL